MKNKEYEACYNMRKSVGGLINRADYCIGRYANIRDMSVDLNCLSCSYLDPIKKSMWEPGKFELDTEEDPQPNFIRNACLATQMRADNVDEEGYCFGSKNYLGEKCKTCENCIYFVENKKK